MSKFMEKLRGPAYHGVIEDLKAFTGLNEIQLEKRIYVRDEVDHELWWNHEFMHFRPVEVNEYNWFYCAAQTYVFTNARKPYWDFIDKSKLFPKRKDSTLPLVLDFGAGAGQNCLELIKRGYHADYYDLNHLQQMFYNFRLRRHGYSEEIISCYQIKPFIDEPFWKFDPLNNIIMRYEFILFPHVLEHIPNYEITLSRLIQRNLCKNGYILEHTPFLRKVDAINPERPQMHLRDTAMIGNVMKENGMKLIKGEIPNIKKMAQPRVWVKK